MALTLRFVYFGRFSVEKGFDILLDALVNLSDRVGGLSFRVDCFGQGELESPLIALADTHERLHYHGWQPFSVISSYLLDAHFCLMPSRFLETFGLTALESLSHGVPVIGFRRGALQSFILPSLAIDSFPGNDEISQLTECINSLIQTFDSIVRHTWSDKSRAIASSYTADRRYRSFLSHLPFRVKKILLVSDYTTLLGGEETYLYKLRDLLEARGFEVSLIGHRVGYGFWGRLYRYILFACSVFNFLFFFRLRFRIAHFQPDIVWYHSVLRSIGWLAFLQPTSRKYQTWMMFHDFGYVHPYPHAVYNEADLLQSLSWSDFLTRVASPVWYRYPFLLGKFLLLRLLRFSFSTGIDRFFVPSEFMKTPIEKTYGISVSVFPHFLP